MNKAELIDHLAESAGVTKRDAGRVLAELATVAGNSLAAGADFTIPDIGKLSPVTTKARKGRNPRTGEPVDIPASVKVKLTVAKALKDRVK